MKRHYTRLCGARRGSALLIAASTIAATGAVLGTAAPANAWFPPVAVGPVPPQNLQVTADGHLQWGNASGATYYYVWRDGQLIAFTAANNGGDIGYTYTDSATQGDGKAHTYKVTDYNPSFPTQRPAATVTEPPVNLHSALGALCWDMVGGHTDSADEYFISFHDDTDPLPDVSIFQTSSNWPCSLGLDSYYLTPDRQYTARVASANTTVPGRRESEFGPAKSFTFEPQPTGFQATPNSTGVHFSWQQAPGASFYKIYSGNTLIASSLATTSYDYKIAPGTTACYDVRSYYAGTAQAPGESQPSQTSCATAG